MKRKIIATILIVAMLATIGAVLTGCNMFKTIKIDEVKSTLENAGYQVNVMTGTEYCEGENPYLLNDITLQKYLKGTKGEDIIEIFFFDSIDSASREADFINTDLYTGQSKEVFYIATKQARKDAGLGWYMLKTIKTIKVEVQKASIFIFAVKIDNREVGWMVIS